MNILNKIEEIRQKPEYIRRRYAWGLTVFSMLFILLVWFISISSQTQVKKDETLTEEQKAVLEEFQSQKESIKDAAGDLKDAYDMSSQAQNQNFEEFQKEGFAK